PALAAVRAQVMVNRVATTPHTTAPSATDPNRVRVEIASARPRTHSAAPRCAARIRLDRMVSQPPPAITIAPSRTTKLVTHASASDPTVKATVAHAVIASVDQRLRQVGSSAAPSNPPRPRHPTRPP